MSETPLEPWRILAAHEVLDRRPWLRVWAEDVQLPDGRVIADFSRVELPDHVVIVALTDDDRVVVTRSYKHGPRRVSLTLPAGYIEPGEDPLIAAQRELREETGYSAADWRRLGRFTVDGNRGCGEAHFFLAHGARRVAEAAPGDLEEIAVELMPFDTLAALVGQGDIALLGVAAAIGLAAAARLHTERDA